MKYRTVVADPPWPYKSAGELLGSTKAHRPNSYNSPLADVGAAKRYGAMSMDELKALHLEVEDDAHLYLWTTNAFIEAAHGLARAWGFRPITILTWVKTKHEGELLRVSMKTGYYFRGATEHIVFAVRGSLRLQTKEALPTAFFWPRTGHSVKPEPFYDLVEQASPGPYLEVFARRNRLGWDTVGNECLDHGVAL